MLPESLAADPERLGVEPLATNSSISAPRRVMALAFETEPTFTPGTLTQLFERPSLDLRNRRMAVSHQLDLLVLLE